MEDNAITIPIFDGFPLLELPSLVVDKVISFVTNPFDLKALRRTCQEIKNAIDRNPDILTNLKVTPKDLKDLENLVYNESHIKWSNFHFPPGLYYVGCRRLYIETFNQLFSFYANTFASCIQILEIDRFDFSNVHHVGLLKKCQKLVSVKVDAVMVKGVEEHRLQEILEDDSITLVLGGLKHLDVTVFEFLIHDYQYEFMGKLLQKCTNLCTLGSWGYFPEWEHPNGGTIHLKYFLWPVLEYLRKRIRILNLLMGSVEIPEELSQLQLKYLNESMDWQSGKWILDMKEKCDADYSNLEELIYSRIKCYSHRAVGWFDEDEFRKSGLSLMKNLSTIYIHHTRDIKLEQGNPFTEPLFPNLENLTLIVGNRLGGQVESAQNDVRLEQVVVEILLNVCRPKVKRLVLDIDLDHHHQNGSIQLPLVIKNFPNLTYFCIEEWGPTDLDTLAIYSAFPKLRVLMLCGRNLSDRGILGDADNPELSIRSLSDLQILKIFSIRSPPKNVFPWPIKENNNITDLSFQDGFSQMALRRFHFLLKSEMISVQGLRSLSEGPFSKSNLEFSMNCLPQGVNSVEGFQSIHDTFKFMDPRSEPANFVIPDIGKWVL